MSVAPLTLCKVVSLCMAWGMKHTICSTSLHPFEWARAFATSFKYHGQLFHAKCGKQTWHVQKKIQSLHGFNFRIFNVHNNFIIKCEMCKIKVKVLIRIKCGTIGKQMKAIGVVSGVWGCGRARKGKRSTRGRSQQATRSVLILHR